MQKLNWSTPITQGLGSIFIVLFLLLTIVFCTLQCTSNTTKDFPNVLFISVDDLNDWIEPLGGHPQAQTPNLSKLAQQSVLFNNAYCASPSCNPSRTALLTGKHPYRTGLYNNPQIWRHVLPKEITLPAYFQKAGYWVAGAGKIFHNNMPDPISWDQYFPSLIKHFPDYYLPVRDSITGRPYFKLQDNEIREDDPKGVTFNMPVFDRMYVAFDWAPLPFAVEKTGDYASVDWTINQLGKAYDKPFFLACGLYRPHLPWYVPQKYYDKFPIDKIQLPKVKPRDWLDLPPTGQRIANSVYHHQVTEAGEWENAVQGYLAAINYADDLIGKLLGALEESAYADNTVVVLFSDHGWQLGEKNHWRKFALWENVIRSVLMIKAPPSLGLSKGTCNRNVSLVDIFPTLTELCDLATKPNVSGKSLLPLLKDPNAIWDHPVITMLGDKHFSIRKNHWHYILYNRTDEELYNLDKAPDEWHNLADLPEFQNIKSQLHGFIPSKEETHELVPTDGLKWADVLSGKTRFYRE